MAAKKIGSSGSYQPTAAHFFKVIVGPLIQGLRIPTVFMGKFGHLLSRRVVLRVPTGASWPVELRQTENGTWLDKGWLEFARYYGVDLRYLVVFRYEGSFLFHVIISDPSFVEICYASGSGRFRHEEDQAINIGRTSKVQKREEFDAHTEDDDDVSLECLGEAAALSCPSKKRGRGRPPGTKKNNAQIKVEQPNLQKPPQDVSCGRRDRLRPRIESEKLEQFPGGTDEEKKPTKARCRKLMKKNEQSPEETDEDETPTSAGDRELMKQQIYVSSLRAKAVTSENPCVVRLLRHYNVNAPFRLTLALGFARNNLPKGNRIQLQFGVEGSTKCWPVQCSIFADRAMCKSGWKEFVKYNRLSLGDVCVFELVSGTPMFKVTIYRNNG